MHLFNNFSRLYYVLGQGKRNSVATNILVYELLAPKSIFDRFV